MKISRTNMENLDKELAQLIKDGEELRKHANEWYKLVDEFEYDKRDAEWMRERIARARDRLERNLDAYTEYVAWFFDFLFGEKRARAIAAGKDAESVQSDSDALDSESGESGRAASSVG